LSMENWILLDLTTGIHRVHTKKTDFFYSYFFLFNISNNLKMVEYTFFWKASKSEHPHIAVIPKDIVNDGGDGNNNGWHIIEWKNAMIGDLSKLIVTKSKANDGHYIFQAFDNFSDAIAPPPKDQRSMTRSIYTWKDIIIEAAARGGKKTIKACLDICGETALEISDYTRAAYETARWGHLGALKVFGESKSIGYKLDWFEVCKRGYWFRKKWTILRGAELQKMNKIYWYCMYFVHGYENQKALGYKPHTFPTAQYSS